MEGSAAAPRYGACAPRRQRGCGSAARRPRPASRAPLAAGGLRRARRPEGGWQAAGLRRARPAAPPRRSAGGTGCARRQWPAAGGSAARRPPHGGLGGASGACPKQGSLPRATGRGVRTAAIWAGAVAQDVSVDAWPLACAAKSGAPGGVRHERTLAQAQRKRKSVLVRTARRARRLHASAAAAHTPPARPGVRTRRGPARWRRRDARRLRTKPPSAALPLAVPRAPRTVAARASTATAMNLAIAAEGRRWRWRAATTPREERAAGGAARRPRVGRDGPPANHPVTRHAAVGRTSGRPRRGSLRSRTQQRDARSSSEAQKAAASEQLTRTRGSVSGAPTGTGKAQRRGAGAHAACTIGSRWQRTRHAPCSARV